MTSSQEMFAELSEDNEVNNEQIEAFIEAENMERTASDALSNRAGNTKILAMAVTAASIASFAEAIWGTSVYTSCMAASLGTGCAACEQLDKGIQACAAAPCAKLVLCGPAAANAGVCSATGAVEGKKNIEDDYGPQLYATNEKSNDLELISAFFRDNSSIQNKYDLESKKYDLSFVSSLMNNFLSSAHAGDSPAASGGVLSGFGITSAALGAVLAWYAMSQLGFLNKLGNGFIRGAYFAVLAGFAWGAVGELNSASEKLGSNADVYKMLRERLIAAMSSQSRFGNLDGMNQEIRNRIARLDGIRDEMNNPPNGALCLVGNLGEQRVDEACACRQNNTCSTVDFSQVGFGNQGLPGLFGETTSGLQTGANSLFSGNLAGANGAFAGISQNAANLRKLNKDIKKKAAAQLDALNKNKSKTNFDKMEEGFKDQLEKIAPSIIKSAQAKNGSTLASLGIGSSGLNTGLPADPNKEDAKSIIASVQSAGEAARTQAGVDPLAGFKFDFPEGDAQAVDTSAAGGGALDQGNALAEFESNESDISDRKGESIFKIITMRYFKSAFPRFFEEEDKSQTLE